LAAAIDAARTTLGEATLLAHPKQDQELVVMVDASADHVGAAQRRSAAADWQLLAFFSKKLEHEQMRYSAFDRELFACVASISHFRYMLEGGPSPSKPTTTPDIHTGQVVGAVESHGVETALLRGRVHNRYLAHPGF
jgi:hypothetical protein